jgi:hypothetical protein
LLLITFLLPDTVSTCQGNLCRNRRSPHRVYLIYFLQLDHTYISVNQAASDVSKSYDALVGLFDCIGNFLKRLRIYTEIPLTPPMTEVIVKIMVEVLSVLALAMKQIKQGRCCELIVTKKKKAGF